MKTTAETKIYILGAGFAGQMLAQEIGRKKIFGAVAAFLDDDEKLKGAYVDGIPVLVPIETMLPLLRRSDRDEAIIAMPAAPQERLRSIYDALRQNGFNRIKILPAVSQIVDGEARLVQARRIDPLDLLGRTPVTIPLKKSLAYLRGKRVLITGAGGSIGAELARQLLSGGAERLYLFGHGENSIYNIDRELRILQSEGVGEKATVVPVIGDMKNRDYMFDILGKLRCDVIFHCAAYKHVPLMEENPIAAIGNNVFGTKNVLDAALETGVRRFVLLSTDKAVSPVSVYGVSKLLGEQLTLEAASAVHGGGASAGQKLRIRVPPHPCGGDEAAYMFVRFGNVLGSRGSVLPLFMTQLKTGGPLTVTHREMKRYFMTIPEASSLVLQTGGVGRNGESYLLDMGDPVRIYDIAEQIIRFSGFEPGRDVGIALTGLRKGERLDETLWLPEEEPEPTEYPRILRLKGAAAAGTDLSALLESLGPVCFRSKDAPELYRNRERLLEILAEAFPSFRER
ncbi:MAG: polysaccharide biosynthesis protein [Spirochaetaceae bacterium]|jgi:FlaA1/EpsC-like NDP-sugar epimerase|nr:polysaccharide biosynthesis protein [Spirochaetaceae bacterium]